MSIALPRPSAHALFGAYARREGVLADESAVLVHAGARRHACLRARYDSPAMRALLLDIDEEFRAPGFSRYKHDGTTTVGACSRDGRRLVLKRYNTKGAWHFTRRLLRRSRACNCFEFGNRLLAAGIDTAAPVAYVESRAGPLKGRSWLLTEYVDGVSCLDYVRNQADRREVAEIAARLERLFRQLAALKITHGDMKASNIVLRERRFPVLIDLDGMRAHADGAGYAAAHQRDRERFLKNWRDRPELMMSFSRVEW